MSRQEEPRSERRSSSGRTVDARQLWSGGAATAVIAALIALVGILVCRWLFNIPVLASRQGGAWGDASTAAYAIAAAADALVATAIMHLLLIATPRPGRQSREAHRGGHDRRNRQRAAGSAQELTLPQQSKAALSGAGFLVEVAQHRRLKTVDTAGFPDEGEFRSGRVPAGCVHLIPSCPEIGVGGLGGAGALTARPPGDVRRSGPAAPPAG